MYIDFNIQVQVNQKLKPWKLNKNYAASKYCRVFCLSLR